MTCFKASLKHFINKIMIHIPDSNYLSHIRLYEHTPQTTIGMLICIRCNSLCILKITPSHKYDFSHRIKYLIYFIEGHYTHRFMKGRNLNVSISTILLPFSPDLFPLIDCKLSYSCENRVNHCHCFIFNISYIKRYHFSCGRSRCKM